MGFYAVEALPLRDTMVLDRMGVETPPTNPKCDFKRQSTNNQCQNGANTLGHALALTEAYYERKRTVCNK